MLHNGCKWWYNIIMLSPAFTAKWEPTKMRSRIISREKMNQRKQKL